MKRHVILVGLPGAGKTTVGKLVAAALGAPFVDLDVVIERRAGKPISHIFAEDGEARFRELERAEMNAALAASPSVIAAGGGWAAQTGNLESAASRGLTVYLRVAPDVAARRVAPIAESGQPIPQGRPLLGGGDVAGRMRELLSARRSFYDRCELTVPAEPDDPVTVAREVANLAGSLAGWY